MLLCSEAGLIEGRKACGPRGREQPTISSPLVEDIHTTDQGVIVSKTRLFGRSHWMNGAGKQACPVIFSVLLSDLPVALLTYCFL